MQVSILNIKKQDIFKETFSVSTVIKGEKIYIAKPNLKTILMWSNWDSSLANGVLVNAQCPVTSCIFTSDVTMFNQSDVVVFYIDTSTNFPLHRFTHQRFVFFNLEPPYYSSLQKISDHRVRYQYFNWTMTYRWDSDIVHRSNYGYIVDKFTDKNNSGTRQRILRAWKNETNHLTSPSQIYANETQLLKYGLFSFIKTKSKLVAWFVSNCFTPSRREEYVQQLRQYLPIDIFGSCTMRKCSKKCDEMLQNDYKFYLAFENSWCPEYVTEKFYRALKYDTVPIVMGGANYSHFAPKNSYINTLDFSSPKALAEYLLLLNKSDALYIKYFSWKKNYEISMPDNYGLCDLCRMAHDENLQPKVYNDIKRWWFDERKCEI